MKQTDPQYKLRLPQELKDRIEALAKASGRSMNAEIVARLQSTIEQGDASTHTHRLEDAVKVNDQLPSQAQMELARLVAQEAVKQTVEAINGAQLVMPLPTLTAKGG